MTLFYLIRHAENDCIGKRLVGWLPGVHLNARGRSQAEALAQILAAVRFKAIYASPLERTMETAEAIARLQRVQVISRPALGEVRPGKWQGQTLQSLRRRKLWPVVQHTPSLARFPEGESFLEIQARVIAELEALRSAHSKATVACVSHGDVIKIAIAYYLGLPLDLFQRLLIAPASISILSVIDGHVRLVCLNDTRADKDVPRGGC